MNNTPCCGGCGSVAESDILNRLERFATLATRLDFNSVAEIPLESHACHASHIDKMNETLNYSDISVSNESKICFCWLKIAIEQGHLEPSQSAVGRIVGWPQRRIKRSSLWIEFSYWFYKDKISVEGIPQQWVFHELLERIFICNSDQYEIPALEHCQTIFATLRLEYERD